MTNVETANVEASVTSVKKAALQYEENKENNKAVREEIIMSCFSLCGLDTCVLDDKETYLAKNKLCQTR